MRRQLLLCPAAAGALALAAGSPVAALRALRPVGPGTSLTGPLVAALALLAWVALGWLLLLGALTLLSGRGGLAGRVGTALLRRAAPVALRRAVAVALGVGVVLGGAGTAGATPAPARAVADAPAGPALDWPGLAPVAAVPAAGPPATLAPPPAALAPPPAAAGTVVVRPGDTLWGLAASRLPAGAGPRAVAAAWPAWWSANRSVIGDDPDLLRPGQSLVAPARGGQP